MRIKKDKLNDKGYSLIELVIVIAIIALLTGISFVTVSMLGSARAREASIDFESQISQLAQTSKSKVIEFNGKDNAYANFCYCLKLYKQDNKYYVKKGYYNPDAPSNGEQIIEATDEPSKTKKYIFVEGENANDDKGTGFSSKVLIKYEAPGDTEKEITDKGVYIVYNRSGRCIVGDGVYHFYKKSNGANIANVSVNKNGSHQSK